MKEEIDKILPGNWDSVEATEIFALIVLCLVLILSVIDGLRLEQPLVREIVAVCLFVLFGGKYMKLRGK